MTVEEFAEQVVGPVPRIRDVIIAGAVQRGVSKAQAEGLLRRAQADGLVFRWIDGPSDPHLFSTVITTREGKARRVDVIPMHPQLPEALRRRLEARLALPTARVFPEVVTDLTRLKDFLRAGIAREVQVLDAEGKPVMIGEGKKARPKLRICIEEEGRVIDPHALRTTLGTRLARAGVAPQIAQRVMRHSDYRTTLKHYTVLGLHDTAAAIGRLPGITPVEGRAAATGTEGGDSGGGRRTPGYTPPAVAPASGARRGAARRGHPRRRGRPGGGRRR